MSGHHALVRSVSQQIMIMCLPGEALCCPPGRLGDVIDAMVALQFAQLLERDIEQVKYTFKR